MNKPSFSTYAANFVPAFFRIRRTTWIAVGVGLLLFGFLIWSAAALTGWVLGQAQNLAATAPEIVRGTARGAFEQAKEVVPEARGLLDQIVKSVPDARGALGKVTERVPGAKELLGEFVPALNTEITPQRDVSGQDIGPVERFPGLKRTQWQRSGEKATVEYEGKADYVKVLDYYAKGFAAAGFGQSVQSSTPEAETHEYTKGRERLTLKIAQKTKGRVGVRIETALQ